MKLKSQQQIYRNLAESLASLFSPMIEVALFTQDGEMLCIHNQLTNEKISPMQPNQQIKLAINKNQLVKAMTIPLEKGYSLRILVDISLFESLQGLLQQYLTQEIQNKEVIHWQQQADNFINHFVQQKNKTLSALNSQDKRAIILTMHEKNLLRYQDATNYLAKKLNVSRATIYNYLKDGSQLKSLHIHQVDSFTDEPFSGNPAGVVLDADNLSDAMMKKIAREMNLSETSFMFTSKKCDIKLRYFTPNGSEVKFCGHSTVAALYMLAHSKMLGMDKPGHYELTIEANVGVISASITLASDESITVQFQAPQVRLSASNITHQDIAHALGISLDAINVKKPVMFEKVNQDIFITISSLKALESIQVNQKSAKQFAESHDIVAYVLLCNETISKKSQIHMRCFAPAVGIPEDPFTGSVLGGLAAYVTKYNIVDSNFKTIRIEQGHFISRPGFVDLKLSSVPNKPPLVIAKARHFFSTEINL